MAEKTILIAEDDQHIRQLVRLYCLNSGYAVVEAADGQEAVTVWQQTSPDLLILDIMLPELDGWEVLKRIRKESNTPVIMLTAKDAEFDKVLGLELGADDYVTKPFSPRELLSRVKAVLRRTVGVVSPADHSGQQPPLSQSPPQPEPPFSQPPSQSGTISPPPTPAGAEVVSYPNLLVNRTSREITVGDRILTVPAKEFDLMWLLASNPNQVFTREHLLETVWDYTYFGDIRTVDVHIRRLRQKVERSPDNPDYIKTVWKVGYKFEYHGERGGQ